VEAIILSAQRLQCMPYEHVKIATCHSWPGEHLDKKLHARQSGEVGCASVGQDEEQRQCRRVKSVRACDATTGLATRSRAASQSFISSGVSATSPSSRLENDLDKHIHTARSPDVISKLFFFPVFFAACVMLAPVSGTDPVATVSARVL
jgi:hypothetical protein